MTQYSDKVMEHFNNPRNVGEIVNPDGVGHVGNPVCISPDTIICTNPDFKHIKDIKSGTNVLSHNGLYNKVIKLNKRFYKGKVYCLRIQNLGNITATPEHHILALKMHHLDRRYSKYKQFKPDWFCTEELQKGDVILYPIPRETSKIRKMAFDIDTPKWDFKSKPLPKKVSLSNDFLRLIGYYLAEGYVRTDKSKGTLGFVFGAHEKKYVKEVINIMWNSFNIRPAHVREHHNSLDLIFYSARLARFFAKHFGKGAGQKHLPHFIMKLSPDRQQHIIAGLWRGDGYIRQDSAKFCTISKHLSQQMEHLLMRQQIVFSYLTALQNGIHKESYHIYIKSIPSLKKLDKIIGTKIIFPDKKKKSLKAWYDDYYFYTPISSKITRSYKGEVYDLTIANTHSYISDSVCLHNCGDVMELYIKVENDIIVDAKFKTFGCGAAIATSSMVTELVKGKSIDEALKVSNHAVAEALGGLPPIKMHCSVLAEEALRSAINDYMEKKKNRNL